MLPDYPNPLQNNEPELSTGFKAANYERFFRENLTIIDKKKQEVPFDANPPQKSLNYWLERYYQVLILKARKMGFSSNALAIAVTKFILGKNEKCVTMSFDQTAAEKQLARAKHFIRSYERINGVKLPLKYNSKNEMTYEVTDDYGTVLYTNTLRVGTAKSTSFGRGDDITFLHLTEVAFCDDVETLLSGVGEAVIEDAHIILETTANGYNSYKTFWDEAVLNLKGFAALFYSPLWEYSQEYLESREKKLGKLFRQEYPMTPQQAFLTSGSPYFERETLEWYSLKSNLGIPLSSEGRKYFRRYRQWQRGEFVLVFADTKGDGADKCAAQFLSYTSGDIPLVYHSPESASLMTPRLKAELEYIQSVTGVRPIISYERNNGGNFELDRLSRLNRLAKYILYTMKDTDSSGKRVDTEKLGWDTNAKTRTPMLAQLSDSLDVHFPRIYDEPTVNELFSFVIWPTGKAKAEVGANDDLVMSLAGVVEMYQTEKPPREMRDYRQNVEQTNFSVV